MSSTCPSTTSNDVRFTAFSGERHLISAAIAEVARIAKLVFDANPATSLRIFDDSSGREIDLNLRGTDAEVQQRLSQQFPPSAAAKTEPAEPAESNPPARGRPKLGVIAREVTLLPRHWDWLNSQPGSASVALRKLIDEARQKHAVRDQRKQAQNATYQFMSAIAGDKAHFEEACRALFASDQQRFTELISSWPQDIREHCARLGAPVFSTEAE